MIRTLRSALLAAAMTVPMQAGAQGTLTVAMTAGDLPITTGIPDQGFEGFRFVAFSLYDALVGWDLSKFDKAAEVKLGLATSWEIDPANHRRWIFKLRESVAFHDGCPFTADDVVWNLTRYTDNKAPQFDTYQFALTRGYITNFESIEKVDSHTVAITTKTVDSQFFYPLSLVVMISKCRAEALKYDWAAYNRQPSGTGPFKFVSSVPRERRAGPVVRPDPARAEIAVGSGGRQLGQVRRPCQRRPDRACRRRVRRRETAGPAAAVEREDERPGDHDLGRA
jgi:peptide/nickel transport system substrate-binding protein